jgi:hypothetical protein
MPIDRYLYIRKAAEIEEIELRIRTISDINAAFHGSGETLTKLQQIRTNLLGVEVKWEPDKDWEEKVKHYASIQK